MYRYFKYTSHRRRSLLATSNTLVSYTLNSMSKRQKYKYIVKKGNLRNFNQRPKKRLSTEYSCSVCGIGIMSLYRKRKTYLTK